MEPLRLERARELEGRASGPRGSGGARRWSQRAGGRALERKKVKSPTVLDVSSITSRCLSAWGRPEPPRRFLKIIQEGRVGCGLSTVAMCGHRQGGTGREARVRKRGGHDQVDKVTQMAITQQPRRLGSLYWTQMKALFTSFHMLYRLSQCSKYFLRYRRQSTGSGGNCPRRFEP